MKNTLKVVNEGELLDIAQNVSETKGSFDQNQLMLDIEKVLRDCEMDRENFKFMWGDGLLCRFFKNFSESPTTQRKRVIDIS